MTAAAIKKLAEHWGGGVRLVHSSGDATTSEDARNAIDAEKQWTATAIKLAAPWPALAGTLEPLGEIQAEELRILQGKRAVTDEHAMSMVCLATRLHRIKLRLDRSDEFETKKAAPKRGKGRPPGAETYTQRADKWAQAIDRRPAGMTRDKAAELIAVGAGADPETVARYSRDAKAKRKRTQTR